MDNFYREEIMEIYKNPLNRGNMSSPTKSATVVNPFCGDSITLELKILDNKILDAKFNGDACAIGVISASFLTENIIGKSLKEASSVTKEQLLDMIGINLTTSRVKCAILILDALHKAMEPHNL